MRIGKLIFTLLLAMFVISTRVNAQNESKQNYHFVYIDHEIDTPVNQLCKQLKNLCNDALETEDPLILYLATGSGHDGKGMQSYTNLSDYSGLGRDTEDAFNSIIAALQNANSHDVNPRTDVMNILEILEKFNYMNDDRSIKYSSVTLDFYVGSRFWKLGYNEKVIAQLFAVLDIDKIPQGRFIFNVFVPKGDKLSYPKGMPFGEMNIQDINNKVRLIEY